MHDANTCEQRKSYNYIKKEGRKMKLKDYLNQSLPASSLEHLSELRKLLYANGYIKELGQATIQGKEAIEFALAWYKQELARQSENKSTGSYGKFFELYSRCRWAILHNRPMYINDIKCRPSKYADMIIRYHNINYRIELKTGTGAVAYGTDPKEVLDSFKKLIKSKVIFVWDFDKTGCPLALPVSEFFELLDTYNETGISSWIALNQDVNGVWQIKLQPISKKKADWLLEKTQSGYDWDSVLETGELELDE